MSIRLRQNTASQEVPLGYFLDSTDGDTPMEALSIGAADIRLFKAGASAMASKNSGGATHLEDGLYLITLDATDTNTLGALVIFVKVAGALAVRVECEVIPAQVYDSIILGTDLLQVDTTQVSGTAQTAGDVIADTNDIQSRLPAALVGGRMDSSTGAMAANVMTAAAAAADLTTEITAGVWGAAARTLTALDEDTTTLDLDATIRSAVGLASANLDSQLDALPTAAENQAGLATAAALATVDGIVDQILVDTAEIGAAGAGLTALASAANLATVDGIVDTILVTTNKLDDTLEDSGGGAYVFTSDALANAPSGGSGGATAGEIADAVWDEALAGHASAGSAGAALSSLLTSVADLPTNAELATALASADDEVLSAVANVQSDTNDLQARLPAALIGGRLDVTVGAMQANVMTAAATAADFVAELAGGGDAPTVAEIWGREIESGLSAEECMRLHNAALFGKASGAQTTEIRYRDLGDSKDRIVADVDLDGNRSTVSLDAS